MTFGYRHRKQIIIGLIIFIVFVVGSCITYYNLPKDKKSSDIVKKKDMNIQKKKEEKNDVELISVDIKGEVITPGLYSLDVNSRVIDVINKAGGLTDNADISVINLSKKISDEMVIIIYSREQVSKFKETKELEEKVQKECYENQEYSLINDACIISQNSNNSLVNINKATKEELMTIPLIGEAKANAIISYREENGPFKTIEDIKNVSGIGDSIFAQIKKNITT